MTPSLDDLRKQSDRIFRLPERAQHIVDAYLHIKADGSVAPCTYHINPGLRANNRVLLGKGTPTEIEAVANKCFKKYDMHTKGDAEALRSFLLACGIGVDCSGFVSWVLNGVTEAELGKHIWKCLVFPGLRQNLISKVRPIENISARLLTASTNATPLDDLSQVRPGDLMRVANRHHVLVIIEVGVDKKGNATFFQYAQSSCMYGAANGVRLGYALIRKPRDSLLEQAWFDDSEGNVIEKLIADDNDSQVVRLKALA